MAPQRIRVNGVELCYTERGTGESLVLVHGGLGDYRYWEAQIEPFCQQYRVLSYSRRYSYPNENPIVPRDHSVVAEAEDLAALVDQLQLGRVHLVGHSYGAYTALALALKRPDMVRTLVMAEPPVLRWIEDVPGGKALIDQIMTAVWQPVKRAFERGDIADAIRIFTDGMGHPGDFESLPAGGRALRLQNARALQALMQSSDAFPKLAREEARLPAPTLIVEGDQTSQFHQIVDDELLRRIQGSERVIISNAGHGTPRENPAAFNKAVLGFLRRRG